MVTGVVICGQSALQVVLNDPFGVIFPGAHPYFDPVFLKEFARPTAHPTGEHHLSAALGQPLWQQTGLMTRSIYGFFTRDLAAFRIGIKERKLGCVAEVHGHLSAFTRYRYSHHWSLPKKTIQPAARFHFQRLSPENLVVRSAARLKLVMMKSRSTVKTPSAMESRMVDISSAFRPGRRWSQVIVPTL